MKTELIKLAQASSAFSRFWQAYPKKSAKVNAAAAWSKHKCDAIADEILTALELHKKTAQWKDRQFIPHPASWLNARRWEDEIETPATKPRNAFSIR